jgi:uncharacterized membrane protein YkvA (DUF1232 family)
MRAQTIAMTPAKKAAAKRDLYITARNAKVIRPGSAQGAAIMPSKCEGMASVGHAFEAKGGPFGRGPLAAGWPLPYFSQGLPAFGFCEVETMVAWNDASELRDAALGRQIALAAFAERERKVRRDFWAKLKRFAGHVPFVEDLVAAYYCALDPTTPMRVRGMLLASLAYFILPADLIPDMIAGLGFADDAALITAVVGLVTSHITPVHRAAAARALDKELPARS